MDIEIIGGLCPACGYDRLYQKYSQAPGALNYDACPRCGFGYGAVRGLTSFENDELWRKLEDHFQKSRKELFEQSLTEAPSKALSGNTCFKYWPDDHTVQKHRTLNMEVYMEGYRQAVDAGGAAPGNSAAQELPGLNAPDAWL